MDIMSDMKSLSETEELLFAVTYTDFSAPGRITGVVSDALRYEGWKVNFAASENLHDNHGEFLFKARHPEIINGHGSAMMQSVNARLVPFRYRGLILRVKTYTISTISKDLVSGAREGANYSDLVCRVVAQSPSAPLKAPQRSAGWSAGAPSLRPRLR